MTSAAAGNDFLPSFLTGLRWSYDLCGGRGGSRFAAVGRRGGGVLQRRRRLAICTAVGRVARVLLGRVKQGDGAGRR